LNVLRSQTRAERSYREALARLPADDVPEPESEAAIARLDAEREMRDVLKAVEQLGRREREVIELCIWEGLTTEEASLALGISAGAVRSRLSRARRVRRAEQMHFDVKPSANRHGPRHGRTHRSPFQAV